MAVPGGPESLTAVSLQKTDALTVYTSWRGKDSFFLWGLQDKALSLPVVGHEDDMLLFGLESDSLVYVVYKRTTKYIKLKFIELKEQWVYHTQRLQLFIFCNWQRNT